MKIPDCNRCLLYAHNPHLVCAVHPDGVDTKTCMDFRPNSNAEIAKQQSLERYSWYGNELIPNRPSRYTQAEQLEILDTHPVFTSVCPRCGYEFDKNNLPVHYDCPECGWMDDSV